MASSKNLKTGAPDPLNLIVYYLGRILIKKSIRGLLLYHLSIEKWNVETLLLYVNNYEIFFRGLIIETILLFLYTFNLKQATMEATTVTSTFDQAEKLTPKDLIRKHIADPTHKITEEEFNKLIVGVFSSTAVEAPARIHS